ncbi:MAG TPA: endonuclease/exonuclease/phosphatase family protein [Pyrinomonadaceae bacterium]|nr:endonuclease/exonuclease/phosphatase family protein [Pyrinomonadaceae bacterium]
MILKLLSYNIRFGGRPREKYLAEVIRHVAPDLVVFQEATDPSVIESLAKSTELHHWAARRAHSIAYLSRIEVAHHEWHYPAGARHSFLEIQLAGTQTRIFGLHLRARFSKWSERRRAAEIQALLTGIARHQNGFHVLVGDFNTLAPGELLDVRRMPAWIRALVWLSGRDIQRETIQIMLDADYLDGYRFLYPDDKGYTFPIWDPHLRLDYVFLPVRFAEHLKSCRVIQEPAVVNQASDHFPLLAHLEITDDAKGN